MHTFFKYSYTDNDNYLGILCRCFSFLNTIA